MSLLNSLGAAACVSVGATIGAGVGAYTYTKVVKLDPHELEDFTILKEKMTAMAVYAVVGAGIGTVLGAYAHSAMTSSVAVPTIATGIPTAVTTSVGTLPTVL